MSVIVGIETDDGVWLAADSRLSDEHEASCISGKIFKMDSGLAFGVVGTLQHAQLIQYHLEVEPPYPPDDKETMKWIVTRLVPALRMLCKEHEVWEWEKKQDRGLLLLMVVHGKLFGLQEDWSVWRALEGYSAVGSGSVVALGSLYTSDEYETKDRVKMAVEAAARHVPSCSLPVHTMYIKK
jgi:hypothetical protein